jgi:hypothetical protein
MSEGNPVRMLVELQLKGGVVVHRILKAAESSCLWIVSSEDFGLRRQNGHACCATFNHCPCSELA